MNLAQKLLIGFSFDLNMYAVQLNFQPLILESILLIFYYTLFHFQ